MPSGQDRVELMETLNISVIDGTGDDNLWLSRYGIIIPYNIMNFMLFSEDKLVTDVLRRFREKQMDYPNALSPDDKNSDESLDEELKKYHTGEDDWKKLRHESNLQQMEQYMDEITPNQFKKNNIVLKKKIIRDKLIEKGLVRSDAE